MSNTPGRIPERDLASASPTAAVSWRWLLLVLLAAAVLDTVGITWGLPGFRSWSPDDITPVGVLRTAHERFTSFPDYPPAHYAVVALVYAPYVGYLWLSGGLVSPAAEFPYGLTSPLASLTVLIVLGRLVSIAMGVGIVYLVYRATRTLVDDARVALFAAAAAAFNAHLVLFSHLGNVDVPFVFWVAVAFLFFVRLARDGRVRDAVVLGISAALGMGTKEVAYAPIAGMALVLAAIWLRERRPLRALALGLAAFLASYAVANNVLFGWDGYAARLQGILGGSIYERWGTRPGPGLGTQVMLLSSFAKSVVAGMGWPLVLTVAAGIAIAWRRHKLLLACALVPALFYYVGVVPIQRDPSSRYALPWAIFLAPLAGVALARFMDSEVPLRVRQVAVALLLAFSFLWAARVDVELLRDARYQAEDYLRTRVSPTATVETYGYLMYLPRLQEMGHEFCQIIPYLHAGVALTPEALASRDPDVIVLSSLYNYRRFGPEVSAYFDGLLAGHPEYRTTVFRARGPAWLGWRVDPRLNPTIWIMERREPASPRPSSPPARAMCPEGKPA